ncbi:type I glutamate--ammonia ligase [Ostreibacterium oceani]|uniref:Glutamine synthetase n=1 Tax=Ostreibacterium oceani TaxID=2654998 RepID=A0A6N7EXW6_9GAMM|nr:type I glutamate--ammonia ligase [Ostreibacterium oceani]MPV85967.1 type I glutamate--ammonia ligase [Ostreibacterium oceani]
MSTELIEKIKAEEIKYADLRFTDTKGKEHHFTLPVSELDEEFFENGKMFDGSSIAGWKSINESDMVLMPDPETAYIDPFFTDKTINITCGIIEPSTLQGYGRDPRTVAQRAEAYLRSTGIADTAFFGPENEFFVFDDVRFRNDMFGAGYEIDSEEGLNNSATEYEDGNMGHRPFLKGGYLPVPPVDHLHNVRSEMCNVLQEVGLKVEVHHHEVSTGGQCEIGVAFNTLVKKADEVQKLKYVIHNVAHDFNKTATFMPKPIVGDNGSGMHVHQSLAKDGVNLFTGEAYGGLSEMALYYVGGIIKHARAINAFTNPSTNSYKRLVPGFEAPVVLAYSAKNRSASIRIPYIANPKARRIEVRFPDSTANPYLAFSAMLMAGLDGIQNKIHPGDAMDKDLYDLPSEELADIPHVAYSLESALEALDNDREFLLKGDVFSNDLIDGYLALKQEEVTRYRMATHPIEFEMYYSL